MKRWPLVPPVLALILCAAFTISARAATTVPTTTSLGAGSWCWFAGPEAIRVGAQTITGYVDPAGDIVAVSLVGGIETHRYVLHLALEIDDHDTPTFYERPDGRIIAFYSKHSSNDIMYRISVTPGDITAWGPETDVPNTSGKYGATHPNPVNVPSEHGLYLYFRGATFHPTMTYSDDEGLTWAPAQELIAPGTMATPRDGGPNRPDRPYAKYAEADNRTYIAFTNAHPQSRRTNIYLVYRRGSNWYSITGQPQSIPIAPNAGNMVFNAAARGLRGWVWDVAVDSDHDPVIVFATFQEHNWAVDSYWYAKWTGSSWDMHELVHNAGGSIDSSGTQPMYAAGVSLDHQDPRIVFLSRKVAGRFTVEVWQTSDDGKTWRLMPVHGTSADTRPIGVFGDTSTTDPEVLYLGGFYGTYTAFKTTAYETHVKLARSCSAPGRDVRCQIVSRGPRGGVRTVGYRCVRCFRAG